MPDIINNGDAEELVKNKILAILVYHGFSQESITTWGVATVRLNQIATLLGFDLLSDGEAGLSAREKINALALSPAVAAPENTSEPEISGTARVGQTLTISNGTWTGYPAPTYSYQWYRDGVAISGATGSTFVLTNDDIGASINAIVTATNSSDAISVASDPTEAITKIPENTVLPVITGSTSLGGTLSVDTGTWLAFPAATYTYQWKRNGIDISGETTNSYTTVLADLGEEISVSVTATNAVGNNSATSNPATRITSIPVNTVAPSISGTARTGETLTVSNGNWYGYPAITYTYEWMRDGNTIPSATNNTFVVTDDEAGMQISVLVTATNSSGSSNEVSNSTTNSQPSWLPLNHSLFADFINNRYWREGDTATSSIISTFRPDPVFISNGNGDLTQIESGELALGSLGLQVVPTSTNRLLNSTDQSISPWSGANVTISTSPVLAPDGTFAKRHTATAVFATRRQTFTVTPLLDYTISWFVKEGTIPVATIAFETGNNGGNSTSGSYAFATDTVQLGSVTGFTNVNFSRVKYPNGWVKLIFNLRPPLGLTTLTPAFWLGIFTSTNYAGQYLESWNVDCVQSTFAVPPIVTANSIVSRTGDITKINLPATAQNGIGGFVKMNMLGFNPAMLPVILGINPATKVAQSLMAATQNLGTIAPAVRTIVFAASPGYTKVRLLGGADTSAVAGDFANDVVSASIGGNGFDPDNNLYGLYDRISLRFGAMNDTIFNEIYSQAV